MWYLALTDTEQPPQPHTTPIEQFDVPVPTSGELEKAKTVGTPGTEYWLP